MSGQIARYAGNSLLSGTASRVCNLIDLIFFKLLPRSTDRARRVGRCPLIGDSVMADQMPSRRW
jgi:hypothetical protein